MSVSIPFSSRVCIRCSALLPPLATVLADPLLQPLLAGHHMRPRVGNRAPRFKTPLLTHATSSLLSPLWPPLSPATVLLPAVVRVRTNYSSTAHTTSLAPSSARPSFCPFTPRSTVFPCRRVDLPTTAHLAGSQPSPSRKSEPRRTPEAFGEDHVAGEPASRQQIHFSPPAMNSVVTAIP
jgi:hypothetical protein